jgi:hypothetical protein
MSKRKFYRTTFELVVLSEDKPANDLALDVLAYECYDGEMIGALHNKSVEELDGKQAAQALLEYAPGPGFFQLTEDGEDEE